MNAPQVGSREISSPSITNLAALILTASVTALNYTEQTDNTSGKSLLNSSKQPQHPLDASPL